MLAVNTLNGDFQTCLNGSLDNSFASLMLCYCFRRMLHTKYFGAAAGGNGRHVCSSSPILFSFLFFVTFIRNVVAWHRAEVFAFFTVYSGDSNSSSEKIFSGKLLLLSGKHVAQKKAPCRPRCHSQKYLQQHDNTMIEYRIQAQFDVQQLMRRNVTLFTSIRSSERSEEITLYSGENPSLLLFHGYQGPKKYGKNGAIANLHTKFQEIR